MKEFGLIGRGLSHSFSADYFNNKFAENNIDAIYRLHDLKSISELSELILLPNLIGLNVTSPYKREVIPFLDVLSEEAEALNAVNVIKILRDCEGDVKLKGYNTDSEGFGLTLDSFPVIDSALIMGTGGASSAVAYALRKRDIPFTFVSRSPDNHSIGYDEMNDVLNNYHLIINATPLGMFPDVKSSPPLDFDKITGNHICYDLIYNPSVTLFMQKAKEKGALTINGLQMLLNQAELGWNIWNCNER